MDRGGKLLVGESLPMPLAQVAGAPSAIWSIGDESCLDQPTIGIVGTRNCSSYGMACAKKFAEHLARAGVTVVSGGALGIDAQAHRGALDGKGKTAAVLGTGADIFHPASNKNLLEQVSQNGVVLSPFALGAPPLPHHFLQRNAIVAALSHALVVIEAPERSGSLSTATAALEMGREVFVLPGPITLRSFSGSHRLIREGATLVDHPDQVIEQLGLDRLGDTDDETPEFDERTTAVLHQISGKEITVESIVQAVQLDPSIVLEILTDLEIEGQIRRSALGYIRN